MNNYEFWDELSKIFNAVVAYQEKSIEFNKRFINPWIRLGNVFDKQERNREAIHAYQKAIEIDPTNAQNWYELGNAYFRMEAYDDAVQAYNKAIELASDSGWSYSNLALTLVAQGRSAEAIPLYQKSIELLTNPKDKAIAWNRLGNAYRKLNEYALALQAFQKADELDRENAGFRDEMDETANEPTVLAKQESPDATAAPPPIQFIPVESRVDGGEGDPSPSNGTGGHESPASESATDPLAGHSEPPTASEADNVEAAPPSGQPADEAETTSVAQNTLETHTAPLREAITATETPEAVSLPAVEEAAGPEPTGVELASPEEQEAGAEAGAWGEAEEESSVEESLSQHAAYEEFLRDNPELPLALAEETAEACEEALPQEAVAKVDPSGEVHLEMDARSAHVWNELGNIYFNSGAYDDAILAYSKAIELDRYFAWPYSNLALTYVQKGRFAEAILLYQRSIELFKDDRDKAISWNRLGNVYRRLNDYENAIAAYQRADELDPANTTISLQSRFSLLGNHPLNQKMKVTS